VYDAWVDGGPLTKVRPDRVGIVLIIPTEQGVEVGAQVEQRADPLDIENLTGVSHFVPQLDR
jgi:hypothetical protein